MSSSKITSLYYIYYLIKTIIQLFLFLFQLDNLLMN